MIAGKPTEWGTIVAFNLGDEVDWTGDTRRKDEQWHGLVMKQLPGDKYEILWTRSDSKATTLMDRSDVPFHFNYRTHEPPTNLEHCTGGLGIRHPKTNEWGNRYGIPGA
jgi:hypothetical protein